LSQTAIGAAMGALAAGVPGVLACWWLWRVLARTRAHHAAAAVSHRRNRAIVESTVDGVLELDSIGIVRYANPAAARLLGYPPEELLGLDYRVLINSAPGPNAPRDPTGRVRYTTDILRGVCALMRRKDGQLRPVEYKILPVREDNLIKGTVLTFSDITERERLDCLIRDMQATARLGGWELDVATGKVHWTEALYDLYGVPRGVTVDFPFFQELYDPEDLPRLIAASKAAVDEGKSSDLQVRLTTAQGVKLWVRILYNAERRGGILTRLHGTVQDVTDRVLAEHQVRQTRDFYELTLDAMPTMVSYNDRDLRLTYVNRALEEWLGLPRSRIIGQRMRDFLAPHEVAEQSEYIAAALRGEASTWTHSAASKGRTRDFQTHFVPQIGADGVVRGFFSIASDLSDLKRLEARLLQAQKMEAVGQLTGGIAHDFNNLLGVVLGNLQLLERGLADNPPLARKVHTAMRAAMRGGDLTRRLLSFARRQLFDLVVLDLNRQLAGLSDLMQRTLGDSIEVRMLPGPDLWHTRVDAGQFENAILNLAINARDAMPQGGRLTVRTDNVSLERGFCNSHPGIEPGDYVVVSIADTGVGIEADVLKRVFEPFFTTKECGKGSGLGLAMVHSFAEQSAGLATIESELGRGTTVKLFLPRCSDAQSVREDTISSRVAPGGDETILVVEDDADLRETVVNALSQLGYRALEAADGEAALRLLSSHEHIDLLFTDIMMPGGMLGPTLARHARELRAGLQVLFTTGYAEHHVVGGGSGVATADLIHKPYRIEDLALRIRAVLDREARVA
jgi:PAS domain S-box-containing protein